MATITQRGSQQWRVQVRRKGVPAQTRTFEAYAEAKKWADQIEGKISADEFIDMSEAKRTTLKEALQRYLDTVTDTKKGKKQERNRILWLQRQPIAARFLASVRTADVTDFRKELEKIGNAPSTIKNKLTIISQVYATAASEWRMEGLRNPVTDVKKPPSRTPRDRRLEEGEEEKLLAACARSSSPWLLPVVKWSIETAMRQGETLSIERKQIVGRVTKLPETKTGKARSVPLSWEAVSLIHGLALPTTGPIFPMTQDSLEHHWAKACRLAGIEDLNFHDLRHEATSRLFEKGLSAFEVMSITGHTTTDMLKRYTHFFAAELALKLDHPRKKAA